MKRIKVNPAREIRVKFSADSDLAKLVDSLLEHYGIDQPALVKMALKKLKDSVNA